MPIKQIVVPNQQSTLRRCRAARCCCRPRFCCTIHNSIYPVPDGKLLLTNTQQQKGDTKSPSSPAKLRRLILLVSRFPTNNIYFMIHPAFITHESQKYDLWPDYARLYSCPGPGAARSCWRAGDRSGSDPDSRLGKKSTNKIWRYTTIGAGEPVDRLQVSHCHPPQTLIYGGLQSLRINYIAVNIQSRRLADWSWHFRRLTLHKTAPRSILLFRGHMYVISSLFWFLFLRALRHGAGNSSRNL